jgi:hypothetical protein
MPAATLAADPGLNEFEVGGRWFACAPHIDPDLLIWVMARAQRPPTNPNDPTVSDWLSCVVGFLIAATAEPDQDALIATLTGRVHENADTAVEAIASVFAGLLALFADHQADEIRGRVVATEHATAAVFPPAAPIRPRPTVADLQRINRKHGRKATGEVIDPGV